MSETPTIIQLPPEVVNQISAGEVIHQPFNVVKELFENAIDAGADQIVVSLENGGFSRIQISDNGCGISQADLPSVCLRHATSKIRQFSDLQKVTTFGFRGEALFSMSCVSHLSVTTKTENSDVALIARYENGQMIDRPQPIASVVGTTIDVCDLFYNKPEKLRAIPDASSQNRQVLQITTQYAIAFPQCSIVTIIDGKEKLHTFGGTTTENVIALLYGVSANSAIFRVEADLGFKVTAKLFLATVAGTKKMKGSSIFVNERLVRCEKVKRAVEGVYSEFLMKGDKPFFVVMLYVPPKDVDVNVHPTKRDVNFANSQTIIDHLCEAIREHLSERIGSRPFKQKITSVSNNQPTIEKTLSKSSSKPNSSKNRVSIPIREIIQSEIITTPIVKDSDGRANEIAFEQKNENQQILNNNDESSQSDDSIIETSESDESNINPDFKEFQEPSKVENQEIITNHIEIQPYSKEEENPIYPNENDLLKNRRFGLNARPLSQNTNKPLKEKSQFGNQNKTQELKTIYPSQNSSKKSISIFNDLKYEPISLPSSKMVRGDPLERTIEQMLSLSSIVSASNNKAEYKEVNLESIEELRENEINEANPVLSQLFQKHIYVGSVGSSYVFFSSGDTLYKCSLFPLTQMFFYQMFLRRFANYGKIIFNPPLEIDQLLANSQIASDDQIIDIINSLNQHQELLEDYFNIGISDNQLLCMPDPLPGYEPSFTTIDIFFFRLATKINWDYEYDCIAGILEELSMIYAVQPEDACDPQLEISMKKMIENVIMPEMRTDSFMPKRTLAEEQALIRINSAEEMYKIFERT